MLCFTDVFRECGGARCVHGMVQYEACRQQALSIIQQLILSPQGDDDMATLLGLMHTSPVLSLKLKTHILKVLRLVHFCLSPRHKSHILKILQTQHSHIQDIEICAFLFVSKTQNVDLLSNLINSKLTLTCLNKYWCCLFCLYDTKILQFQALLSVLRESHRTRTVFRKVNGFVYVMSLLLSMEGSLLDPPKGPWDSGWFMYIAFLQEQIVPITFLTNEN